MSSSNEEIKLLDNKNDNNNNTNNDIITTDPNKNWNDAIEDVVTSIGDTVQGYKIMHLSSAYRYNKIYEIIMYMTIVLSPIAGIIAGIETVLLQKDENVNTETTLTFGIIISIFTYTAGVLAAVIKFGKFTEKSDSHKTAAVKYTSLETNIRRQLYLFRKDREEARAYLDYITKSAEELYVSSPYIFPSVYKAYCKDALSKGRAIPEQYSKIIDLEQDTTNNITELTSTKKLEVNSEESPLPENVKISIPRRNSITTPVHDLNKYNDAKMKYELQRFVGF